MGHISDFEDFFRPIRSYFYWEKHCYDIPICISLKSIFDTLDGVDEVSEKMQDLVKDMDQLDLLDAGNAGPASSDDRDHAGHADHDADHAQHHVWDLGPDGRAEHERYRYGEERSTPPKTTTPSICRPTFSRTKTFSAS